MWSSLPRSQIDRRRTLAGSDIGLIWWFAVFPAAASRAWSLIVTDGRQFECDSSKPKQARTSASLVEDELWNAPTNSGSPF
jgi:hypothetical protein